MTTFQVPNIYFPNINLWPTGVTNLDIGGAGLNGVAFFQAPKDGDITDIKVGVAALTQTPSPATLQVRIETWDDVNNKASGSLVNAGASGTVSVLNTEDNTYLGPITLSTPATVTKGTVYCAVFTVTDWTSGVFRIARSISRFSDWLSQYVPYSALDNAGTYTYNGTQVSMVMLYDGDSGYIPPNGYHTGIYAANRSFASTSNPDEYGIKFTYPVTVRATGMYVGWQGSPLTFHLYDSTDTDLLNFTPDPDYRSGTPYGGNVFTFPSDITINADEVHRFTAEAITTTSVLLTRPNQFEESMAMHSGTFTGTSRNNGGAWTDGDDLLVAMGLLFDGIDVSAGGVPFAYGFG